MQVNWRQQSGRSAGLRAMKHAQLRKGVDRPWLIAKWVSMASPETEDLGSGETRHRWRREISRVGETAMDALPFTVREKHVLSGCHGRVQGIDLLDKSHAIVVKAEIARMAGFWSITGSDHIPGLVPRFKCKGRA